VDQWSLYVHLPFCLSRCAFCDLSAFQGVKESWVSYVGALKREIEDRLPHDRACYTIYVGGGTPSWMPLKLFEEFFAIGGLSRVRGECEQFSMEANPSDITPGSVHVWRSLGVNRITLGLQTFDSKLLETLGRTQQTTDALRALELLNESCMPFGVDLLYGIPGQTLQAFEDDLTRALAFSPDHVSCYALTIGYRSIKSHFEGVQLPDDDLMVDMMRLAQAILSAAGYDRYEVSNWSRNGRRCLYNWAVWHLMPYVGIGAAAHSATTDHGRRRVRRWNVASPKRYIALSQQDACVMEAEEQLERHTALREQLMIGLRLVEGVCLRRFREDAGCSLSEWLSGREFALLNEGLVRYRDGFLFVTERGWPLTDAITRHLLA